MVPRLTRVPSDWIPKVLIMPTSPSRLYRNLPSELIAMSRLVAPLGLVPTMVPDNAVNAPFEPMIKPEMVEVPAFEV